MKSTNCLAFAVPILAGFLATPPGSTPQPAPAAEPEDSSEATLTPLSPEAELEQNKSRLEAVKTQLFDQGK